jgi:hypothetical protein
MVGESSFVEKSPKQTEPDEFLDLTGMPAFKTPGGFCLSAKRWTKGGYSRSSKHYGYSHYHVEAGKLIRQGLMSREEALKLLEVNFDRELLDTIGDKLGTPIK